MLEVLFPPNLSNAPCKKFRGKKRYFRRVLQKAQEYSPSLEVHGWYDLWHYHADWEGYGNLCWTYRAKHIEALCIVFVKFASALEAFKKPHQLFLYLDQNDAGQDAVYFHTQNPNRDNFPCQLDEAYWGVPMIEEYFSTILPKYSFRAGQTERQGSKAFFIYSPKIGESLERP